MNSLIPKIESQIKTDPYNPIHHIALAKAYLEEGNEERVRKIIAIKRQLPSKDPMVHFEWGKLCEELGMAHQARESYDRAIALDPKNSEYHFRVALLYQEKGAWERALKHLQRTVSLTPQNLEAKKMLSSVYEEMGLDGSANFLQGKEKKSDLFPQTISFEIMDSDVSLILDLFKGREFGYARYHIEGAGDVTPLYVKGTLGRNEIFDHIKGEETLGVYPLRTDRTLRLSCVHIGIPWRRVVENIRNSGFLTLSEDKVHHYAKKVFEKSRENGIPAYLENSGDRDRKIWFFFEEFIPLELAERFINNILDKVQAPFVDITLDLYLGIKGAGLGWKDYPIMLPLGVNRRTGKRCFFIDEYGNPDEDQLLFLKKIRTISREDIKNFLKIPERPVHDWLPQGSFNPLKRLEKNCPVVEEVIRKAHSGRMLRHDEKLVIYFTLGFLDDGFRSLHSVLEPCPDYRPRKVDRIASRLRSNPISCPKIRELLPELTAYLKCNCSFGIPEGGYPSPLLHVDQQWITLKKQEKISPPSTLELMKRYDIICQKIEQLIKEKEELKVLIQENTGRWVHSP